MDAVTIGTSIRERRAILSVRQVDLAELAGVSLRTLVAIEKGDANPSLGTLNRLATILGMELTIGVKR